MSNNQLAAIGITIFIAWAVAIMGIAYVLAHFIGKCW